MGADLKSVSGTFLLVIVVMSAGAMLSLVCWPVICRGDVWHISFFALGRLKLVGGCESANPSMSVFLYCLKQSTKTLYFR
jgi:hypothetical protein